MSHPINNAKIGSLGASSLRSTDASSGQTICLVNDNSSVKKDKDIWVLFVGNPANVTTDGKTISGLRNLSIPIGSISTPQAAGATIMQSDTFVNPTVTLPATPFPLAFISGLNASTQVQVTGFDSSTGTFTVQSDPTLPSPTWPLAAQATGDQFVVGAYSQQLSTLHLTGTTESTLSGLSPNVYTVTAQTLDAAVVYLSYGQLTYLDAAPAITSSSVAFQTVELTTGTGGGATTSDLTVIDYFGIPLQIQSVNQADGSITDTRTFYFKYSTIAADLKAIGATLNLGGAGALYLGPGQVTAGNKGNPSPFPSFKGYLQSLTSTAFQVSGSSNYGTPNPQTVYGITVGGNYQSTYNYSAQFSTVGDGGFNCVLTPQSSGNSFTNAPSYFPAVGDINSININLPAPTPDQALGYDSVIYGAVLDASSFSINTTSNAPPITPTSLSGPFEVTAGSSTTQFTASALAMLATPQMSGLNIQFTSGANNGAVMVIASVTTTGLVTLAGALNTIPGTNDQFQILFSVTSASAQNTSTFFGAAPLTDLNFLAPFKIVFQTGGLTDVQGDVVAIDAAGNMKMLTALPSAPQAGDLFAITVAQPDVFTQLYTNSTFSWLVSDVLAGLNFGFPGGSDEGGSSQWYGGFPQQFPFGLAGVQNDGNYNPWAALFYNASDAYGFAFSDRVSPSPLMSTSPTAQNFCITVLPETQIDAPVVTATPSNNTITLSWTPEDNISYTVTIEPPTLGTVHVNSAEGQASLSGLAAGTPYTIRVEGSNGSQASLVLPVYTSTTGSLVPTTGEVPFAFAFTWAGEGNLPPGYTVNLNGTPFTLTGNPASSTSNVLVSGSSSSNLYVLDFQDENNNLVYQAVVSVNIGAIGPAGRPTSFSIDTPVVFGSAGGCTPAPANGPYTITYPNENNNDGANSPLVVGITFAPVVRKEFAPVIKAAN